MAQTNNQAGTVKDLWIDRAELMFRYLEVSLKTGETVLLPMTFSRIKSSGCVCERTSWLRSLPMCLKPKAPTQITLLEEEKITAYYGAGTLYATPERQEPLF
jgi:photosynthetic reaction center H subunit